MSDQLYGMLVGGLIGSLGSLAGILVIHWLERRREDRERANWQLTNVSTQYFSQYLSDEIKESRARLRTCGGRHLDMIETLRKDRNKISHGLQRIGVMIYVGSIPLNFALIMNAYQIVQDWLLIASFVEEIRGDNRRHDDQADTRKVPYHRRHGEWLALVSWMWIRVQSFEVDAESTRDLDKFEAYYGGKKQIARRERLLFSYERRLAAPSTSALASHIRRRFAFWRIRNWLRSVPACDRKSTAA
jgi:hypothetical protein